MKIRLLTSRVDSEGQTAAFGDVIDVPFDEGQRLVANGYAQKYDRNELETAMLAGGRRMTPDAPKAKQRI